MLCATNSNFYKKEEEEKKIAEMKRKEEDTVLYIIQGNVNRAKFALLDKDEYKDAFFLATGSRLMKSVEKSDSEAREVGNYLRDSGIESSKIFESADGIERIGNFFHMRDSLDKILRGENITDVKMPIQDLYSQNYIQLVNKINTDILNGKEIIPIGQYEIKPGSKYIEKIIQLAINHDIKNGIFDLDDLTSVENYVQRIENASDNYGGFVKTASGLFVPKSKASAYETVASGYKTFLK